MTDLITATLCEELLSVFDDPNYRPPPLPEVALELMALGGRDEANVGEVVGLLERGEAPNPTVRVLDAIAQRLGLNMLDMLTLAIHEDGPATQTLIPAVGDSDRSGERRTRRRK